MQSAYALACMNEDAAVFMRLLHSQDGVAEEARQILAKYRSSEGQHVSKEKDKGSSQTDMEGSSAARQQITAEAER